MKIKRKHLWFGLQVLLLLIICKSCIIDVVDPLGSIWYRFGFTTVILGDRVTHMSLSPDKSKRIVIVYLRRLIPGIHDLNYELRLQQKGEPSVKIVYESGDLQGPIGTERVVWSTDSSKFILLTSKPEDVETAKHYKKGLLLLKSGEAIIFIYDVVKNEECSPTQEVLEEFILPNQN